MPFPELPGEITDRIISHVGPDIPSLLNCALVCSRWLPASRHHLFTEINSPPKSSYKLLVARVLHSESMRPWLASVRSVAFFEEDKIDERTWKPRQPEEQVGRLFIRDFIGHLPNMRYLRFQGGNWTQCRPPPRAFVAFSQFPSLCTLDLFGCQFPSFAALRQMLSALPGLSSLMIKDAQWPASPNPHLVPVVGSDSRPMLETLRFVMQDVNHCGREFMDWLVQTASRISIRRLEVLRGGDPATNPWSVISSYTHMLASAVNSLRITYLDSESLACSQPCSEADLTTRQAVISIRLHQPDGPLS
ncbi:hypothetical protein C8T65DRAFT_195706 [Cerioporus squamosus]|nr:hypothetical protein C8T65DRAFT_195706 [Cerioporus squamosus]